MKDDDQNEIKRTVHHNYSKEGNNRFRENVSNIFNFYRNDVQLFLV